MDKTATNLQAYQHKGFFWLLKYLKIKNPKTGRGYLASKDYFGFIPDVNRYQLKQFKDIGEQPDLIYISDLSGVVLRKDGKAVKFSMADKEPGENIFGGCSQEEVYEIRKHLKDQVTLIGEFNILHAPTQRGEKKELEEMFGVRSSGWYGKYFESLASEEMPAKVIKDYEVQTKKKWDFLGHTICWMKEKTGICIRCVPL